MDQVTEVFAEPVTVTENCKPWDAESVEVDGLTPTETVAGGVS